MYLWVRNGCETPLLTVITYTLVFELFKNCSHRNKNPTFPNVHEFVLVYISFKHVSINLYYTKYRFSELLLP